VQWKKKKKKKKHAARRLDGGGGVVGRDSICTFEVKKTSLIVAGEIETEEKKKLKIQEWLTKCLQILKMQHLKPFFLLWV